ncbi:Tmh11 protein [Saccharomycopsis crataegensis]|uniref:Tmh11 protein n=1 Tax=Saccharomycopsis crataegensis TaxID=43959 RepID=A0AAV5QKH1_9ASCO|nr:Tmh11 protein [Saccharomycopsis crataegensis]
MEHPSFTLSALCLVGGTMGYVRKGSVPSLVAGVTISAMFGTAGYLLKQNADWGLELAISGSALMLAGGISRGIPVKFRKPVPLVLTTLGALSGAYYLRKYNEFYG